MCAYGANIKGTQSLAIHKADPPLYGLLFLYLLPSGYIQHGTHTYHGFELCLLLNLPPPAVLDHLPSPGLARNAALAPGPPRGHDAAQGGLLPLGDIVPPLSETEQRMGHNEQENKIESITRQVHMSIKIPALKQHLPVMPSVLLCWPEEPRG